jgi:two-component system response regulator
MDSPRLSQVLVVEDDENDSDLLMRQMAHAQIEDHVRVIADGREALDVLYTMPLPPMALFLDLKLRGGMNGIELLRNVRAHSRLKDIPVFILTGSVNPRDFEECTRLGVTAYLSKPVDLMTFIKTIAHLYPHTTTVVK